MYKLEEVLLINNNDNHNKFYKMTKLNDKKWEAVWGKVGTIGQNKIYSMDKWETKFIEKINKGYNADEMNVKRVDLDVIKNIVNKIERIHKSLHEENDYVKGVRDIVEDEDYEFIYKLYVNLKSSYWTEIKKIQLQKCNKIWNKYND